MGSLRPDYKIYDSNGPMRNGSLTAPFTEEELRFTICKCWSQYPNQTFLSLNPSPNIILEENSSSNLFIDLTL